ncbi:hypothetical protein KAU19_03780 [Candidatus Parcubacteria bacterium]|nr:hypothetical protein [Candidatus Parcubacteria bacterium]
MTTKKELLESGKKVLSFWPRMLKYSLIFFSISIGLLILVAIMKIWFVHTMYSFYLGKVISAFGLDLLLSKVIAIFATVVSVLLLPWVISFLFLGRRKVELIIVTSVIFFICSLALYYGTGNVFFDRATGKPAKYYIKTLDGFKFSSSVDYDPMFGIKYKPITGDVIKEYYFWQKTGKLGNIPQVQPGRYFDMITGEPIVWYIERTDKEIELFSLPGYDPLTGEPLKPITKEVIKNIGHNFNIYGEIYSSSNDEIYLHSSFNINIDKEIFGRDAYNSTGIKLKGNKLVWGSRIFDDYKVESLLDKIFFFKEYIVISLVILGNADNSRFTINNDVLLIDSLGVRHKLLKRFFMIKYEHDYCYSTDYITCTEEGILFNTIPINENEIRILLMVFEKLPKKLLKKGRIHFSENVNIDFTIIE